MPGIDFAELRSRIQIFQVLELAEFVVVTRLGEQVRGPCPIHGSSSTRSRSFSANLRRKTFRCFRCGALFRAALLTRDRPVLSEEFGNRRLGRLVQGPIQSGPVVPCTIRVGRQIRIGSCLEQHAADFELAVDHRRRQGRFVREVRIAVAEIGIRAVLQQQTHHLHASVLGSDGERRLAQVFVLPAPSLRRIGISAPSQAGPHRSDVAAGCMTCQFVRVWPRRPERPRRQPGNCHDQESAHRNDNGASGDQPRSVRTIHRPIPGDDAAQAQNNLGPTGKYGLLWYDPGAEKEPASAGR